MSPEYSLCPQSKVYVLRVQFMSIEYSYVHRVQFMSLEYILCPQSTVFQFQEYSLCPQSTVYVLKVQFLSPENSLCP